MGDIFKDLRQYLTDFRGCEEVFLNAFKENEAPIKTVLELGVYQMKSRVDFPGQSTKTLIAIHNTYPIDYMVSLDIMDCSQTIQRCFEWAKRSDLETPEHNFVQMNSLDFMPEDNFPEEIDFIFIDTCHDGIFPSKHGYKNSDGAGMTYKEIVKYAPYLSRHGVMFLHDTKIKYVPEKFGFNVCGAVDRFLTENSGWDYIEHKTNKNGLGELRRTNES